jgi:IS1 family transposase
VVDRQTRCYLAWAVVWVRSQEAIQQLVDRAPKAKWYFSDGFDAYQWLWYHFGCFEVAKGKSETYSVEADNAELRHYLARLARRSRCFSRCPYALECAIRSFVYAFNRRQLYRHRYPLYPANVIEFVSPHF